MSKRVEPIGPTDSPELAIVGEAPGREEEECGVPFVGASGRLLTSILKSVGVERKDCYITNIIKERPYRNNFGKFYRDNQRRTPRPELLMAWDEVAAELEAVKPKIVVLLGGEALRGITGERSINDFRGCMFYALGHRCIPTYHPAYILRVFGDLPIFQADLTKAVRQARTPQAPQTFFNINPSYYEVMYRLKQRPQRLVVDLETIGSPPVTRCIGLAWSKHEAMSIPLVTHWEDHWSTDQEHAIMLEMQALFDCPDVKLVFQNFPFDVPVMEREFGFSFANIYMDTMFAMHTLYPELKRKSLNFICSLYTDHPAYWHYQAGNDESTFTYNCMDCVVTYEASIKMEEELKEAGLTKFYFDHIHPAITATARMGHRGVLIDLEAREAIRLQTQWEMSRIKQKLVELTGKEFNPSSSGQVSNLLYKDYKLPPQRDRKTSRVTTDDKSLRIVAKKFPDYKTVIELILEYRRKRILITTFLDVKLRDNRVFTNYNLAGTVTGRLASGKTIEGLGGNLQNIPRGDFRRIFVADPNHVLIKADLSQAEYRCLIWIARIERVIKQFTTNPEFSIHKWNAAENIYRVPYDQITPEMYSKGKSGTYGANYGIEALKVSRMYNMNINEAKMILNNYHESVPEIKGVFQQEIRDKLKKDRTLVNPLGRRRIFYDRLDESMFRAAYSFMCQSLVADIITDALVELDELGYEIVLQVHDELVVHCKDNPQVIDSTVLAMRHAMERPIKINGVDEPLCIPVEVKIGKNWCDAKPYKKD